MKACVSCQSWNGSILHPHCGMFEQTIQLDPEWRLIRVDQCHRAEDQRKFAMQSGRANLLRDAYEDTEASAHFFEFRE